MKRFIVSNDAPKPVGPYSHAVLVGNMLFVSGQLAINPVSGKIEGDDIKAQTQLVFKNIEAILKEAGFSFEDVVKVNVYLTSLEDFAKFNEVYSTIFTKNFPARTTVEAKLLPGALIEVDVIAAKE
ncbi:endoribonuclease L-PSP [Caldicellulosiruptor acetigenus I77R1B]|uniref:Endoribonuclease L-PSP n=1 Tax=Caldicellulosiruptor acetigenus (strain ATCC 700853 / DSM 12137 / I77R1B) TaxID=632335 RepID=E4S6I0_CALA7|nr:Rid family detoxifying hydrolase [Caldicellulosiruptor acetigenus]ADQ39738.1 endoribonuclease L-PSP [Caldicellulosiruptor acetigenus I77R1B]